MTLFLVFPRRNCNTTNVINSSAVNRNINHNCFHGTFFFEVPYFSLYTEIEILHRLSRNFATSGGFVKKKNTRTFKRTVVHNVRSRGFGAP